MTSKQFSVLTALLCSTGVFAQQSDTEKQKTDEQKAAQQKAQQQQQQPSASQQDPTRPGQFTPPGQAGRPQTPPGRAFDTQNPPPGRPFQSGDVPAGSPFESSPSGAPGASQRDSATGQGQPQPGEQPPGTPSATSPSTTPSTSTTQPRTPGATDAQGRPGSQQTGQQTTVQINQQQITQLQTAFSAIKPGQADTQKQQLTQTIMGLAPEGRVSQEFVTRFVTDVTTILPRVQVSPAVHQRLASAVALVLSPNLQPTQLDTTLNQVRQVLVQSGVQPIQAQTIACDLHLIAAETHPNLVQVQVRP